MEAGSSKALARWMKDNGYRYPEGMDEVTDEYVAQSWCFVAIKAALVLPMGLRPSLEEKCESSETSWKYLQWTRAGYGISLSCR